VYQYLVLKVKDAADVAFVRSTMAELGRLARKDAGCVRFEVYHSQADKRVFFLNEIWEDAASLDAHRKAPAFVDIYMAKVVPKLDRVPHPCDLLE
jgi:quinol monooxygenase YgiN